MKRWSVSLAIAICFLRVTASGQSLELATLTGTVVDQTGSALAGATVTLSSPALIGGARSSQTDPRGTFRFSGLLPGPYAIHVAADQFADEQKNSIHVPAGATLNVIVRMHLSDIRQTLRVGGTTHAVDVTTPSSPAYIDETLLHHLPSSRSLADTIDLAPAVADSVAYGGTRDSNLILIDGVDATDPAIGSQWLTPNYNWLQGVQVLGPGAGAEHGQSTGAIVQAVLRSGSNRFAGLAEYWTVQPGWISENTSGIQDGHQEAFAPRSIVTWFDTSAQLGGPVVSDRLWFFSGLQHGIHDDRVAGFGGPGSTRVSDTRFINKLDWLAARSIEVHGYHWRETHETDAAGLGPLTALEAAWNVRRPIDVASVRLTWTMGASTVLAARVAGYDGYDSQDPRPPNARSGPASHIDLATGRETINAMFFRRIDNSRLSSAVSLTHHATGFAGQHTLKFGAEIERAAMRDFAGYNGGIAYLDYASAPYLAYIAQPTETKTVTRRGTAFMEDIWRLNRRVTLTAGLRVDTYRGAVPAGEALSMTAFSPRVGIAWDVFPDHSVVARAHYGRYCDPVFGQWFSFLSPGAAVPVVLASVVGPGRFVEISRTNPPGNAHIDSGLTLSSVDQAVVGVDHQLTSNMSSGISYIWRRFGDFVGYVNRTAVFEPATRVDPGPDGLAGTADDGGQLEVFRRLNPGVDELMLTNPDDATRRYDAVQVFFRRRYANRWQMQASYVWSRARGVVGNFYHTNAGVGGTDLGRLGVFVDPNRQINAEGIPGYDVPHEFKVLGTYRFPVWGGFNVSGVAQHRSGTTWERTAIFRGLGPRPVAIKVERRGTRRLEPTRTIDLRVEKTVPVASFGHVGLYLDIFNVMNRGVATGVLSTSGPAFGSPVAWTDGRLMQAGVRLVF